MIVPERLRSPTCARWRVAGLATLLAAWVLPVGAHYPWITVDDGAERGTVFRLHLGHAFPSDGVLAAERLRGVRLVAPDGSVQELQLASDEEHPLSPVTGGAALLVAEQRPAFWSRTHEGGRQASRERYPDAFSCSESRNVMKAVVGRGGSEAWRHRRDHGLELLPMRDPGTLRAGEPLALRVLFHGEPWAGEIKATYAGYRREGEDDYALSIAADTDGVARFVPAVAGHWLVRVHAAEDYPDPAVCDRRSYYTTLTFVVD